MLLAISVACRTSMCHLCPFKSIGEGGTQVIWFHYVGGCIESIKFDVGEEINSKIGGGGLSWSSDNWFACNTYSNNCRPIGRSSMLLGSFNYNTINV